jgi:hypothetical protein
MQIYENTTIVKLIFVFFRVLWIGKSDIVIASKGEYGATYSLIEIVSPIEIIELLVNHKFEHDNPQNEHIVH